MAVTFLDMKNRVAQWLDRSDAANVIPLFIQDAQTTLERDMRLQSMETWFPLFTLSKFSNQVPVPSSYIEMIYMGLTDPQTYNRYRLFNRFSPKQFNDAVSSAYSTNYYLLSVNGGCTVTLGVTTGAITSVSVTSGGTKNITNLILSVPGGTNGLIKVSSVLNGTALTASIVAGGSGYSNGSQICIPATILQLNVAQLGDVAINNDSITAMALASGAAGAYATLANWTTFAFNPALPQNYYRKTTSTADAFFLDAASDKDYITEILYYSKFTPLVNDTDSNWWTNSAEELLRFTALELAAVYFKNAEDKIMWEGKAVAEKTRIYQADKRERSSGQRGQFTSPNIFLGKRGQGEPRHYDKYPTI